MSPAHMSYSKTGLALTEGFEGCKLTAYQDIKGVPTAGYGHTGPDVVLGWTYTQAQADLWLQDDISWASKVVNTLVHISLTQPEFDALTDLVFNIGSGNFAKSTVLHLLNANCIVAAAQQFDQWDRSAGVVVAGLLRRRAAETAEFNEPAA
jgi:lysozyme